MMRIGWCNQTVLLAFVLFSGLNAMATGFQAKIKAGRLDAPIRYDYRYDQDIQRVVRDRLQYQLSVSGELQLFKTQFVDSIALGALLSTGSGYTSPWNTAENFNLSQHEPQALYLRQVFFQMDVLRWRLQAGVIPPVKGKVSETSLDKDGWIRGARLVMPVSSEGKLELVYGVIDRLEQPNAFASWGAPNYAEVEWTQKLSKNVRGELGFVEFEGDLIPRGELRVTATHRWGRTEFAGEILKNLEQQVWAHDWSIGHRLGGLEVSNEYAYVPIELGLLGTLSNDYFTAGHIWVLALKGPLFDDSGLYWFARNYLGEERVNYKLGVGARYRY